MGSLLAEWGFRNFYRIDPKRFDCCPFEDFQIAIFCLARLFDKIFQHILVVELEVAKLFFRLVNIQVY